MHLQTAETAATAACAKARAVFTKAQPTPQLATKPKSLPSRKATRHIPPTFVDKIAEPISARDGLQSHVGGGSRNEIQGESIPRNVFFLPCLLHSSVATRQRHLQLTITPPLPAPRDPEGKQKYDMLRLQRPLSPMGFPEIRHLHLLVLRRCPPWTGRAHLLCPLHLHGRPQGQRD